MEILAPTIKSLLLQMQYGGKSLASGTGFIMQSKSGPVLITCRHNLTGRHNTTNQILSPTGAIPDAVAIFHNVHGHVGKWIARVEDLAVDGKHRWIEHPELGGVFDCVALPLTKTVGVDLYPYDIGENPKITVAPSDAVSVVGFPFGLTGGGALAIWATGFIATELEVDLDDLPKFLIDCRARPGQSGSAVVAHRNGGAVSMEDRSTQMFNGPITRFLGIYSGRINDQSDLGTVWKAAAIQRIVDSL